MVKKVRARNQSLRVLSILITSIILTALFLLFMTRLEEPRFQRDSIDNPLSEKPEETKATLLEGSSDIGVLLIHGLGATAFETKRLAEYLNSRNITTYQVLLAGHGKDIYDLEYTTNAQWYESVEDHFSRITNTKKFVIGSSLGGLLTLELSTREQIDGVILLSTPIFFNDKRIKYSPVLRYFQRFHHRDIGEEHRRFYHENFPLKTLAEMIHHIDDIKKILPEVTTPSLIIQSKADPRIDPQSPKYIYDNIQSEEKEIMWMNSDKHVLIIDYLYEDQKFKEERDEVFKKVYDFIITRSV